MLKGAIPVLHVASAARAQDFYCGRLGFRLLFAYRPADPAPDPCYFGVRRDDATLHVSSFPGDGASGCVVSLSADDIDALHATFIASGVAIQLAPTDQTWGDREMYIKDPDGNQLRFSGPVKRG